MGFAERLRQVPAAVFVGDDLLLVALMGGAAVADEYAAFSLNFAAGEQAGAGDGDEGVAGGDAVRGPAVEAAGGPGVHSRGETLGVEAGAVEEIVGGVEKRKAVDEGAGQAFALESCPGPGGVDLLEMIAPVELVCEFEVVEDSKDGLGNFHEVWLLSSGNASR
jgi:hypothetical protein